MRLEGLRYGLSYSGSDCLSGKYAQEESPRCLCEAAAVDLSGSLRNFMSSIEGRTIDNEPFALLGNRGRELAA